MAGWGDFLENCRVASAYKKNACEATPTQMMQQLKTSRKKIARNSMCWTFHDKIQAWWVAFTRVAVYAILPRAGNATFLKNHITIACKSITRTVAEALHTAISINVVRWKLHVYATRTQGDVGNFKNKVIKISNSSPICKKKKQRGKNGATRDLNVGETNVSIHYYTSQPKKIEQPETTIAAHTGQQRKRREN